jgi:hypothetical protein
MDKISIPKTEIENEQAKQNKQEAVILVLCVVHVVAKNDNKFY